MLNKVQVITALGAVLELPLDGFGNEYIVEDIEGLDPNKATMLTSSTVLQDGVEDQGSREEGRDIILKLEYDMNHPSSVSSRRHKLYQFLMPQSLVTLRFFMEDMPVVDIVGRVENMDAPMFAKEPKATISVFCHKPAFYSKDVYTFSGNTTDTVEAVDLTYNGTSPAPISFDLRPNRTMTGVTLYQNLSNGAGFTLQYVGSLLAGDLLEIETAKGFKGAWLTRAGVRKSVLNGIAPNATWLNLYPGENALRAFVAGAAVPYTIEYRERFGGL